MTTGPGDRDGRKRGSATMGRTLAHSAGMDIKREHSVRFLSDPLRKHKAHMSRRMLA